MNSINSFRLMYYLTAAQLYDEGKNIYDCFLVLVESVLYAEFKNKKSIGFDALKTKLNEELMVDIPSATLNYLITKLQYQKIIAYDNQKKIKKIKNDKNSKLEEITSDKEEKIQTFFYAFKQYLLDRNIEVDIDDLRNQCSKWIYNHTLDLLQLIDQGIYDKANHKANKEENAIKYEAEMIEYLIGQAEIDSEEFKIFFQLYSGALQTSLLNFTPNKIENICKGFTPTNVILDSNYILRILGLQSEFESKVAQETLKLLKKDKAKFYVLERTLSEIIISIKNFLNESEPYSQQLTDFLKNVHIRMNGLWEAYNRGVSRTRFLKLTQRNVLKQELHLLMDVKFIEDDDEIEIPLDLISDLTNFKANINYTDNQAKHDLALISYCQKMRSGNVTTVSNADWWVLTNDIKLSHWNCLRTTDVQDCLTEVQLNNLLWIQREKNDLNGLYSIMAYLSNNDTLSIKDIHDIARKLNKHMAGDSSNNELDALTIIFANTIITKKDIDLFDDENGIVEFTKKIRKRREEKDKIQIQLIKEKDEMRTRLENERARSVYLEGEVKGLKNSIEKIDRESEIEAINEKVGLLTRKIDFYEDIEEYKNKYKKIIERTITTLVVIIAFLFMQFLIPNVIYCVDMSIEWTFLPDKIDFAWVATILPFIKNFSIHTFYLVLALITGRYIDKIKFFSCIRSKIMTLVVLIHLLNKKAPLTYIEEFMRLSGECDLVSMKADREKLKSRLKES